MPPSTPDAFSPWIAFATLLRREVMRYLKLAIQTIGAPFLSNLLFLTVFGGVLAERAATLAGDPDLDADGKASAADLVALARLVVTK